MASYVFSAGCVGFPVGAEPRQLQVPFDLHDVHRCIDLTATQLNMSRDGHMTRGFARVDVTRVYHDPRDGTEAFTVTFSDNDEEMATRVRVIVKGLVRRAEEHEYSR